MAVWKQETLVCEQLGAVGVDMMVSLLRAQS